MGIYILTVKYALFSDMHVRALQIWYLVIRKALGIVNKYMCIEIHCAYDESPIMLAKQKFTFFKHAAHAKSNYAAQ